MQKCGNSEADGEDRSDEDRGDAPHLFGTLQLTIIGVFLANILYAASSSAWDVLSGFEPSLLWALLCSIALRDLKQYIVSVCRQLLATDRTLLGIFLNVLTSPLRAVCGSAADIFQILKTWKRLAREYEARYRRQQAEDSHKAQKAVTSLGETEVVAQGAAHGAELTKRRPAPLAVDKEDAATPEPAKRPVRCNGREGTKGKAASSAQALGAMSSLAKLGVKAAFQNSGKTPWRRGNAAQDAPAVAARQEGEEAQAHAQAQALFRWLFSSCVVYELFCWFLHSWMAALQLLLVCFTMLALLGLVPLLYFLGHWYLAQQSLLETGESPQRSLSRRWSAGFRTPDAKLRRENGKEGGQTDSEEAKPVDLTGGPADEEEAPGSGDAKLSEDGAVAKPGSKGWLGLCKELLWAVGGLLQTVYLKVDKALRRGLEEHLNTLVTVSLIVGLLVGTVGMGAFMGVQIAQEGRSAVRMVTEALPTWSAEAYDSANASLSTALVKQMSGGVWQTRIKEWQGMTVQLANEHLPVVYSWLSSQVDSFVVQQNLTELARGLKTFTIAFQPAEECTAEEREVLTVSSAKASLAWRAKSEQAQAALEQARVLCRSTPAQELLQSGGAAEIELLRMQMQSHTALLAAAFAALEERQAAASGGSWSLAIPAERNASPHAPEHTPDTPANATAAECNVSLHAERKHQLFAPAKAMWDPEAKLVEAQKALVAADEQAKGSKLAYQIAVGEEEAARAEMEGAQQLLKVCLEPPSPGIAAAVQDSGAIGPLLERLQDAYADIWQLHFMSGLGKLQAVVWDAVKLVQEVLGGQGQPGADLGSLQRAAQAATEPLIALAKSIGSTAVAYLGSGSAVAINSGMGVLRLGMGVVNAGIQFVSFAGLLYLLLSLDDDPVLYVVRVLPISRAGQEQAAAAFSNAMRGVFLCAVKLALFHALFTWLTLRMFQAHFVYASTLASAIFALLPFIPPCVVVIPSALQLFIQSRSLAAVTLIAAHFGAYNLADDILLREIPGSHPYFTGLGIFGGMATFVNPLQGAIVGPMLLSLLSVFFNLHGQFMSSSGPPGQLSGGSSQRLAMSRSASFDSSMSRLKPAAA